MINERIALIMLHGEVNGQQNDPHHAEEFYHCMQTFAASSLQECTSGNFKKFERYIKVASKLYHEGNETVKNGIVNVYLYTLSHALDIPSEVQKRIAALLPKELLAENNRQHYCGGI